MVRVDEPVFVSVNKTGEPIGFQWRGASYLIGGRPVRWFARREWWVEAARVQRGIGAGVLEVEMWRLLATEITSSKRLQVELVHRLDAVSTQHKWQMVRVYN